MTAEMRYNNIMSRFKKEADMPVHFTDLSEEQKVLVEMVYESDAHREATKTITETVSLIKNDLEFVLYELDKLA